MLKTLQKSCSSLVIIIAILGLFGYIPGMEILGNIREGYIPTAPTTSISFLLTGFVTLQISNLNHEKTSLRLHKYLIIALLVALFGILQVSGFILEMDLTFENRLVPDFGTLHGVAPIARMSPATAFSFFISGISLIFYIIRFYYPSNNNLFGNIGSTFAILLLLISSTFTLAYLYGIPLLYGENNTVPMALNTAIGFILLSISILTIEKNIFIFKLLTEDSTRSYILRYLLPFSIVTVIFSGLGISFGQKIEINPAFIAASESIFMVILAIIISIVIARVMSKKIESVKAEEIKARKSLQKSEELFRTVSKLSNDILWEWQFDSGIVNWFGNIDKQLGYEKNVFPRTLDAWKNIIHPEDQSHVQKSIDKAIQERVPWHKEYKILDKNGKIQHWVDRGEVLSEKNGIPLVMAGAITDITEQKQAEEKLQLSSRVFKDTHEGIIITDTNRIIVDVNPAFSEITGYSREDVLGQHSRLLSSDKQSPKFFQNMWQQINENGHWQGEIWNLNKTGELYAELLTISALKDDKDNVVNYVGVFTDITHSKQQQEQLSLMAHYDVLTGLPNRALFVDRFHQAIAHSKRTKAQLAVCFLDLDDFKPVNDNYGHDVGDQLLVEVAKRISENIREEDTVSRQGGDEFAILLSDIESFAQCKQTLKRIHHSLTLPYLINGHSHNITASTGLTLYPSDDADIDTLLRHADQAMYQAKVAGKHCYHLFNAEHDQQVIQKHNQLKILEFAFANNEFELYYQPKVNMLTGDVFGAEALIRWNHPEKGLIPPLEFLPIISGSELEIKVGNWVVIQALQQLDTWQQQGIKLEVSVNISSYHLLSKIFLAELESTLANHPEVTSNYLQLEILESSALSDLNAISSIIKTCQNTLGVHVALDDFGTGYSSLTHLRSLPVDIIKIDQSFVRDMLDDPSDYAIIDGIIGLADSFNRDVIAEGVETTNHGLMLMVMGCKEAQGYGIAKPMPANDFPQWLKDYIPNQEWKQYGNKHRSTKENRVELFILVARQWKEKFINNIQSLPEDIEHWSIMNSQNCPCGIWINRAKQEQLFESESVKKLDQIHETVHLIAQTLLSQYQNGNFDAAREGLPKLQTAFDDMGNALGTCE